MQIADQLDHRLVFAGVPAQFCEFWKDAYGNPTANWIGYIDDDELPIIVRNAFCLAQPSTEEGYGYPPLEAMACQVPVVVSDIPIFIETTGPETLKGHISNPASWLNAFQQLEDPRIYQAQVEKGTVWAEKFKAPQGWQPHIRDILELIN